MRPSLCIVIGTTLTLAGCDDGSDWVRSQAPKQLAAGEAVYYHAGWSCAGAVYRLPERVLNILRTEGIGGLENTDPGSVFDQSTGARQSLGPTYGSWRRQLGQGTDDMSYYTAVAYRDLDCLVDPYRSAAMKYLGGASQSPGYVADSGGNVVILAPTEGWLFVLPQ